MGIKVKRSYDEPEESDGYRILVDRLWPRGLTKGEAKVDLWLREIGPSDRLRTWFGHDPKKWGEFERHYFAELDAKRTLVDQIVEHAKLGPVTLLFSTSDTTFNNAEALKEYIEARDKGPKIIAA